MKQYDIKITLHQILEALTLVESFAEDGSRDEKTLHAVARMLEIIGEAANRLSPAFRDQHPSICWRDMIDMRNFIMHGYDKVSPTVVWQTVEEDLPALKRDIQQLIEQIQKQGAS